MPLEPSSHHKHSPSSFPIKANCTQFESEVDEPSGPMKRGLDMHQELAEYLEGKDTLAFSKLEAGDQDEVQWAGEYIKSKCGGDLKVEEKVSYTDAGFRELFYGTVDAYCGNEMFDLKTGEERSYWHQMAAYALALMEMRGLEAINVHVLFSRYKFVSTYTIEKATAQIAIEELVARIEDPNTPAVPNEYCGWCDKQTSCPALAERVFELSEVNDWRISSYKLEELDKNPEELSKAVKMATMGKFEDVPDYEWREMRGRSMISDMPEAFSLLEKRLKLSPKRLIEQSTISLSAIEDVIMDEMDLKKGEAKKLLAKELESVISRSTGYRKLVKSNTTKPKHI